MLAIGNGEKCPYCDLVCEDGKVEGKDVFDHLFVRHNKQFQEALHLGPKVNKDGLFK